MKLTNGFLLIPLCAIFVGCSKSTDGVAPGALPVSPPSVVSNSSTTTMKYGTTMTTSSGWILNYDSADPVKAQTTANGWHVEIKYE